ncbi:uncharacterized protein LOC127851032 [Dreissena polymorpha]|uniref:BZIP domain-containing protein n=1 Tax=Dreissena polymorpha TaxID=45954 RepID=A0A9D4HTU2_DREPO|nr:uncharacterized protein LOC127851032 [Dreissena polymorpha]KAH3734875.1 hypothetical protein DPMN_041326 [Dreissena polymorpha]
MITEAYQALGVIENFEADRPFDLDFNFTGEFLYEDITAPNTPLKEKKQDPYQIFYDAEYRAPCPEIVTSPSVDTRFDVCTAPFSESETIVIPDDDEEQPKLDAGETAERSFVELRDACSPIVWKSDDSGGESLELSPAAQHGRAATGNDDNCSTDHESDTAPSGIPTIVHDAGNSHALSTSDADLKQRMKDKIRFRRESQGIGEINVEDLFEEPRQYDLTPEERAKEERRKKRNRVSAEKSRKKRIEKEKTLEQEYDEEEKKNTELAKEVHDLRAQLALLTKVWKCQRHSSSCRVNMFPQFDQRARTCSASNSESELSPMNPAAPQSPRTSGLTNKRSASSDEAFCPGAKVPRMTNNNGQKEYTQIDITNGASSVEFTSAGSRSSAFTLQTSVPNLSTMANTPSQMPSTAFDTTATDIFALQDAISMATSYDIMTSSPNNHTPTSFADFPTTTLTLCNNMPQSMTYMPQSMTSLPAETSSSYQFTTSNISTCASGTPASLQMTSSLVSSIPQTEEQKAIEMIKQTLLAGIKSFI